MLGTAQFTLQIPLELAAVLSELLERALEAMMRNPNPSNNAKL